MRSVCKPEVLISQVARKLDENGTLVDEPTKELMRKQLQALKDLVLQLRAQV